MNLLRRIVSGLVLAAMLFASVAAAVYGADHLTQATLGVGVLCLGVFIAILARIAQAADHHAEIRRLLERSTSNLFDKP